MGNDAEKKDYLVTGDHDFEEAQKLGNLRIISVSQFQKLIIGGEQQLFLARQRLTTARRPKPCFGARVCEKSASSCCRLVMPWQLPGDVRAMPGRCRNMITHFVLQLTMTGMRYRV